MQFIGWVAPSCVRTNNILDGISSKLQYSVFCVKRIMNRLPACMITLILGKKWSLGVASYFLVWLFYEKMIVQRPFRTILHFFTPEKLVIDAFMGHILTSIYILYAWMIFNLLMLHVC